MTGVAAAGEDGVAARVGADGTSPMTGDSKSRHLRGDMGVPSLILSVLAFNGPLTVVVGFIPVVIGFGNGLGAPAAFIAAGTIVGLFAVGYVAMGRTLPNPGAFYSYITAGLGREAGLGGSYLALLSYFVILGGCTAFFGISMQSVVRDTFGGPELPWWLFTMVVLIVIGTLGYFRIDFSVRVLGVILTAEVLLIVVFDAAVIVQGGVAGLTVDSFTPAHMFSGSVGLALLFAITCFSGFEATAIFRDEVKDPARTIRRATYGAVLVIGLIYAVGSWVMVQALGAGDAVEVSAADPTGSFYAALELFTGNVVVDIVKATLCLSILAASLSTHNVAARYVFNLGADGILPKAVAGVHPRYGSPYRASVATSVVLVLGMGALAVLRADPSTLYAVLLGVGGYALILLMLFTSVAVAVYMAHSVVDEATPWNSKVAPGLAIVSLAFAACLASTNLSVLIGDSADVTTVVMVLSVIIGIAHALILKRRGSPAYLRIGRQEV